MNQKLKTVRLYGKLGAMFGRVHMLAVESAAEAVRALCVICPGFEQELFSSKDRGVGYVCYLDKLNLPSAESLEFPAGDAAIRIAPVYTGSKRGGLGQVLLGAVIVAAAVWLSPVAAAGATTFLGATGGYAVAATLGASLMLSGVLGMVAPQAKGLATKDGPDNGASYNMNGATNTTAQGNCVPAAYGRVVTGSATISSGIYAEDQQ